jgi:hypothetical protein
VPAVKKRSITPPITSAKRARTSKVTGAGAVADVADALWEVAAQFNADADGTSAVQTTPQRRTAAIRVAASDPNLTRDQRLQVLHLFRDNISAADAYLAIDDTDLRTDFILGCL